TIAARVTPRFILDTTSLRIVSSGISAQESREMSQKKSSLHQHRRFAAGGNGNDERDPRDVEIERLRERVRELEIQHEIRQIRKRIRELEDSLQGGQAVDFVDLDFIDSAEHLIEKKYGDGPTVVTGGPVASMATLPFVPEVQRRKGDEASNWVMEPHENNDTVDLGLYVKNDFFNKIGLVDCGPQDQMGRKDYEGPTTTSLDVLKSLSSKIATTKCVGAELFERFNLIANSDRFNAPYDPGGTGLVPGETTREVKLFRRVMVTIINGSRVDVPFDPGDFAPKAKLEDEFFRRGGE
ncbi:hypothetical protein Tco_1141552, partial [Tanacetum coccineum]